PGRRAEFAGAPGVVVLEHIAHVNEPGKTRRVVAFLDEGRREDDFGCRHCLESAAERLAEAGAEVDRTQGVVSEAAHVGGAAGEEILEERQAACTEFGDHGWVLAVVRAGPVDATVAAAIAD